MEEVNLEATRENSRSLKNVKKTVSEILPPECGLVDVEMEGSDVVIYLHNVGAFFNDETIIKRLAGALRKKILVRCDPKLMVDPETAIKKINEIVPPEAGIRSIRFDAQFNEAVIEAMKPGLVIGKQGSILRQIMEQTGWAVRILRQPTMPSETIDGIRASILKESVERRKMLLKLGKRLSAEMPAKSEWVKITALGGFKEVGRSCLLLETQNNKILVDCGINAETTEPKWAFPYLNTINFSLDELDAVVCTHAHMDHCGFIPYLYAYGYDGPLYCTKPTRDLMALLQFDYLEIMHKSGIDAPYAEKDIRKAFNMAITRDFGEVTDITPEMRLTFQNAGHILGSAMVHLHIGEGLHNLVHTGDFKFGPTRLLNPAHYIFPRIETLLMEATYGSRNAVLPRRQDSEMQLMQTIKKAIENGGKVLIPVFAVGRSQEIMILLEEYATRGEFNVPVYIDGMILEASAIHTAYPEYLNFRVHKRILSNDSPFESEIFELVKRNRQEIVEGEPCVILAPSGMLSGGPSVEYLRLLSDNPKNMLIFVGYQSASSIGRRVQSGVRELPTLGANGKMETMRINMQIETVEGFSGHSDWRQLLAFIKNLNPKPKEVMTMHGDENRCNELADAISRFYRLNTRVPINLDSLRLK